MKNKNTIIFDMDGTLLNTLYDLTDSVNYVLNRFGMPPRDKEDYRKFFGSGVRYAISCAVPEDISEEMIDEMIPVFKEHYNIHCLDKTRPYEGIINMMKTLKNNGYKLAIVSNKIDSAVKELNEKFFKEYVDVAIGEKVGIKRKPSPDMVNAALKELNSGASEAVYVGDSEVDIATANNSKLDCICVLWGFRDKDYLIKKGANTFVKKPEDIICLLEEQ